MNTLRQPYNELSLEVYNALVQAKIALEKSELDGALIELVYLRVSQINGCAFCLEMHSKALRKSGDKYANEVYEKFNKTAMTPFPNLSDTDINDILAYTSNPPAPAPATATGGPTR